MSNIFQLATETCGTCTTPDTLVQTPDQCAADKIIGVAPAVVGFMTCDVGAGDFVDPTAPTLAELAALVTANKLSFKQVWQFVENGEAVDGEITIDAFTPAIPYGKTKQFTFEDSYFNTVTDANVLAYWNDKTNPAKARKANFCTIYRGVGGGPDLLTVYKTRYGYKLTPSRAYDATAKTNFLKRSFTLDLMWEDPNNELVAHIYVVGLYDAYKGTF